MTMFQQQPAARVQAPGCLLDDLADVRQPVRTGRQGLQRLMPQGRQVRVGGGHIGRVGDDQAVLRRVALKP